MRRGVPLVTVSPKARDPLLIVLIAAIGAGNIEFGTIHDDTYYVDGVCDEDGRVRINLSHHVVAVCLHEVLHRMRPRMKELTVRQRVGKLMRQLSDDEIDTLYTVIQSVATTKTNVETL